MHVTARRILVVAAIHVACSNAGQTATMEEECGAGCPGEDVAAPDASPYADAGRVDVSRDAFFDADGAGALDGSASDGADGGSSSSSACDPSHYTAITNTRPLPSDFCAYDYLPFRAVLPVRPQSIDQTNTVILQQHYIPNSVPGTVSPSIGQLATTGVDPSTSSIGGNSMYPLYVASASDPLVHVDCSAATYGCSDASGNKVSSIPDFHIPAWARPSGGASTGEDHNIEIIQPNGDTALVYGCPPVRDWRTGDTIGSGSAQCSRGLAGAAYGSIVSSPGINTGALNGGDDFAALPAHFEEVKAGRINHALVTFAGCFTGAVYPGHGAKACISGTGIPSGAHMWLSLDHAQIDALPASVMPAYMRVFAYAAHDYGIYTFDTGDGNKWIGQPMLEDALPYILSGASRSSFWTGWFQTNGGALSGDANLKLEATIDWRPLAQYMFVLDPCYARGTCADSVPPR
jgi:hypothetical protein